MPKRRTPEICEYEIERVRFCCCPSCLEEVIAEIETYAGQAVAVSRTPEAATRAIAVFDQIAEAAVAIVAANMAAAIERCEAPACREARRAIAPAIREYLADVVVRLYVDGLRGEDLVCGLINVVGPRGMRTIRRFLYAAREVCPELCTAAAAARRYERFRYERGMDVAELCLRSPVVPPEELESICERFTPSGPWCEVTPPTVSEEEVKDICKRISPGGT